MMKTTIMIMMSPWARRPRKKVHMGYTRDEHMWYGDDPTDPVIIDYYENTPFQHRTERLRDVGIPEAYLDEEEDSNREPTEDELEEWDMPTIYRHIMEGL